MKRAPLICLGLLLISGPIQQPHRADLSGSAARLQSYWLKKTKKEILRTGPGPVVQALDNSLRFVADNSIKKILPFLYN